jgi:hypothetical protein
VTAREREREREREDGEKHTERKRDGERRERERREREQTRARDTTNLSTEGVSVQALHCQDFLSSRASFGDPACDVGDDVGCISGGVNDIALQRPRTGDGLQLQHNNASVQLSDTLRCE